MGFSGGGSNVLLPHTHDGTVAQDGGALDFSGVTQAQLNSGDTTYSDGVHLQQLAVGNPADVLTVSGGNLPSWVAPAGPAASAWTILGTTGAIGAPAATLDVTWALADVKDFLQIYAWTGDGGGAIRRYLSFYDSAGVVDVGNNYASQNSTNFAAPTNSVNQPGIGGYDNVSEFDSIQVCCADATQSKLVIRTAMINSNNSAGTAPTNRQVLGKWADTTNEIRGCQLNQAGGAGLFAAGSGMIVLGTDL